MRTKQYSRRRYRWLLPILIFAILVCILVGFNGIESIALKMFPDYFENLSKREIAEKEKEQLEIDLLESQRKNTDYLTRINILTEENEALQEALEIKDNWSNYPNIDGQTARVFFKDPNNLFNTFLIDKGSDDGLMKNMTVIGKEAVIGRIIEVKKKFSRVRTLHSPRLSFGAMVTRSKELGVLSGGKENLTLSYLTINSDVRLGDKIITSGTTDITPGGLPLGEVIEVVRNEPEQELTVKVSTPEKINEILFVWVVTSIRQIPDDAANVDSQ